MSSAFGVVVPFVGDPYFGPILDGMAREAYDHDLRLVVCSTLNEHGREAAWCRRLDGVVDGTIVILPEQSSDELAAIQTGALVVVDTRVPLDPAIPTVTVANEAGAAQAVDYLVALGHRRIGAIAGPPGWVASDTRLEAYRAALSEAGLDAAEELVVRADPERAPGEAAAGVLLNLADPPTAVFAFNDAVAAGVLQAAAGRGLRVPDDLSIVGFDDIVIAAALTPPLTTVRQPLAEVGRAGVKLLLRLRDGGGPAQLHVEMPTRLVIRGSTAAPPSGRS